MKYKNLLKIIFFSILILIQPFSFIHVVDATRESLDYIVVEPDQNIQAIIDEALAHSTLYFTRGVYTQSFTISKPLTLIGEDKNSTVFTLNTKPNNAGIILSAEDITLKNVTISNMAPGLYSTAIRINGDGGQIENCRIFDTPIGITVWSNYCEIANSEFKNCSDEGILLISTKISQSFYNRIHNCSFSHNCDAIEMQYSSYNQISDCYFSYNTHSAIDAICEKNNHNLISNCQINDNEVHGIYFSSSQHNIIQNCSFLNNGEEHILFTHNSYNNSIINSSIPQVTVQSLNLYSESFEQRVGEVLSEENNLENQSFFDRVETLFHSVIDKIRSIRDIFKN